jgi:hypothetical protein
MCALPNAKAREQGKQAPSIDDALQWGTQYSLVLLALEVSGRPYRR